MPIKKMPYLLNIKPTLKLPTTFNARLTAQMFDGGFFACLCKKADSKYLSG
jgi:hypothetical protein